MTDMVLLGSAFGTIRDEISAQDCSFACCKLRKDAYICLFQASLFDCAGSKIWDVKLFQMKCIKLCWGFKSYCNKAHKPAMKNLRAFMWTWCSLMWSEEAQFLSTAQVGLLSRDLCVMPIVTDSDEADASQLQLRDKSPPIWLCYCSLCDSGKLTLYQIAMKVTANLTRSLVSL